jgi:hypothetical protein
VERVLEEIGSEEMLLFATDYPHWHFDGTEALPDGLPNCLAQKILVDNPMSTYSRLDPSPNPLPQGEGAYHTTPPPLGLGGGGRGEGSADEEREPLR